MIFQKFILFTLIGDWFKKPLRTNKNLENAGIIFNWLWKIFFFANTLEIKNIYLKITLKNNLFVNHMRLETF